MINRVSMQCFLYALIPNYDGMRQIERMTFPNALIVLMVPLFLGLDAQITHLGDGPKGSTDADSQFS